MSATSLGVRGKVHGPPWGVWLMACLIILLLLRVVSIAAARTDLSFDEAQYWSWSQVLATGYYSKPPLIAWLIAAASALCGDGETCIRLPAAILNTASAGLIFLAGRALLDAATGFWAALLFAAAPGIALSSGLITTDVPLLFFWSAALLAWVRLHQTRAWSWAAALAAAIGLGLLSKYAMAYFFVCAGAALATDPQSRWILRDRRGLLVAVVPLLMAVPNVWWNIENGLATFAHTADNAAWSLDRLHPLRALEFAASQLAVFGPLAFVVLLAGAWWTWRRGPARAESLLLAFSLPVLTIITVQALLSRAHANWAAAAYPAGAILVAHVLIAPSRHRVLAASLAVNLVAAVAIAAAPALARQIVLPGAVAPFEQVLGWRETAAVVRTELGRADYGAILSDERAISAALSYYLRDAAVPIRAWSDSGRRRDHYQMRQAYRDDPREPVLYVGLRPLRDGVRLRFADDEPVGVVRVVPGGNVLRSVHLVRLRGFRNARP